MKKSTPPRKSPKAMRRRPAGERSRNSRRTTASHSPKRRKPRLRKKPINSGYTKQGAEPNEKLGMDELFKVLLRLKRIRKQQEARSTPGCIHIWSMRWRDFTIGTTKSK